MRSGLLRPLVLTIRPSEMNRSLTSMAALSRPARIEAQVQNQPPQLGGLKLRQDALQLGCRVTAEGRQPHVAKCCFASSMYSHAPSALRWSPTTVSIWIFSRLSVTFSLAFLPGVHDGQGDRGPLIAAEFLHGFVAEQAIGALAVDLQDAIARQQTRPVGGRAVHRAEHLELARRPA